MKKVLFFTFAMAFTASLSAQIVPSMDSVKEKTEALESVTSDKSDVANQIKGALMKDKDLQAEALGYLKSNPDTAKSMLKMATKSGGSNMDLIKTVLGNKDLTAAAIEYISSNPKLLSKAMKIIGM